MYVIALFAYLRVGILSRIGSEAVLLMWIVTGFAFYPLYKWDITRKLKNIIHILENKFL